VLNAVCQPGSVLFVSVFTLPVMLMCMLAASMISYYGNSVEEL